MHEFDVGLRDSAAARLGRGRFIAVVGPSGAGKDTLISCAAERLAGEARIGFARRVITRPADGASEDHDSLSEEVFQQAEARGAFCLTWGAHGLRYGLPASLDAELARGISVVANVSRQALARAVQRFGPIQIVEVTVQSELLLARLAARGREPASEIEARLKRQVPLELPAPDCRLRQIDNSGELESAVALFVDHLRSVAASD